MTDDNDFFRRPIHGPAGRISAIRKELDLTQAEFAEAIGTTRETVSHWENFDSEGNPRQRTTRRNAEAIAELARQRLGRLYTEAVFFGAGESATDLIRREQMVIREQLDEVLDILRRRRVIDDIAGEVTRLLAAGSTPPAEALAELARLLADQEQSQLSGQPLAPKTPQSSEAK